jgi:hypothetical protein
MKQFKIILVIIFNMAAMHCNAQSETHATTALQNFLKNAPKGSLQKTRNGEINIAIANSVNTMVIITDVTGKTVRNFENNSNTLNTAAAISYQTNLSKGLYFATNFINNIPQQTQKIIIN